MQNQLNQQLTPHFNITEMMRSSEATALGIKNIPTLEEIENARLLCVHVLEPLRVLTGGPISILSGGRSKALNDATKDASKSSDHRLWRAADIKSAVMDDLTLATLIQAKLPFDQLILEFFKHGSSGKQSWVHVSWRLEHCRQMVLHTELDLLTGARVRNDDEEKTVKYFLGLPRA